METVNILSLLNENPEGTFLEFASFNGSKFGTCEITGRNPGWEMHPDTDEFFSSSKVKRKSHYLKLTVLKIM
jgi:hypothetical protein